MFEATDFDCIVFLTHFLHMCILCVCMEVETTLYMRVFQRKIVAIVVLLIILPVYEDRSHQRLFIQFDMWVGSGLLVSCIPSTSPLMHGQYRIQSWILFGMMVSQDTR